MKHTLTLITVLLLLPFAALHAAERFPGTKEDYHGVTMMTVPLGAGTAKVLCPQTPLFEMLWVLAPTLYNPDDPRVANLARTELELVKRGFYVVAIEPGNASGSPESLKVWDAVYAELTGKYKFSRNAALMGMGKEALPIVRWAAANPGKTLCLYLDHPEWDLNNWPGEKLASAKVAIVEVSGGMGSPAQAAKNGERMRQYEKAGGAFKQIEAQGQDKGFYGLSEPKPVVEFLRYHTFGIPEPTLTAAYGPHPKQVLAFWKAPSEKPTPLVIYIHGGSWLSGCYIDGGTQVEDYLKAGISVAAVEYRFLPEATADGVKPPVKGPLSDAARALQFIRSKAGEWNIRKDRIAARGVSAGACSSLWLAFHKDLADPQSSDPIARESTRLFCVATRVAQTSLDPAQMKAWTPNSTYGGHAFGFVKDSAKNLSQFDVCLANRETILPWIAEYSPYALATADAPPVFLEYLGPPNIGKDEPDPTHTTNFGAKLQERLRELKVDCELVYRDAPNIKHRSVQEYLIDRLKAP